MAATVTGRRTPFLRRAGLLTGLLALIAGILGMHIMPGSHSMPAPSGHETATVQGQVPTTGHGAADRTAVPEASGMAGTASAPGCGCADPNGCSTMSSVHPGCTPTLGNASLAAPPPGTTPLVAQVLGITNAATTNYSYLPASPTPGDLSISRT
ncbi:MAG TPA: hypothetical protein VFE00_13705 [Arthrobacter sp.]|nr:hypothetical protein [Arthrobacter sp.]